MSVDDYLNKKSGKYFDFLNIEKLKRDIISIIDEGKNLVIEGVILHKVLNVLDIKPDYCIYITNGIWIYDWIEEHQGKYSNLNISEIIALAESDVNKVNMFLNPNSKTYKMDGLRKEIYEYTYEFRPWNKAKWILEIV